MLLRLAGGTSVLDIAPFGSLSRFLNDLYGSTMVSIDSNPAEDGRTVKVQADVTNLPLASGSIDLVYCSHVLEHVEDDARAMAEIGRVLSPSGVAYIQVPRRPGLPTAEDPAASPDERLERFGRSDHVRLYGDDFEARLMGAGLRPTGRQVDEVLPDAVIRMIAAKPGEELWFAGRSAIGELILSERFLDSLTLGSAGLDQARLDEMTLQRDAAVLAADDWAGSYQWLSQRWRNRAWSRVASVVRRKGFRS